MAKNGAGIRFATDLQKKIPNFAIVKQSRLKYRAVLAIVLLLLLAVFPHHHHEGGAVCMAEEICQVDGNANDAHTSHGADHQRDSHYCYWQPVHKVPGVHKSVDWTWQPSPLFVSTYGIRLPQIVACSSRSSWSRDGVWTGDASPLGKQIVRRGPPVFAC